MDSNPEIFPSELQKCTNADRELLSFTVIHNVLPRSYKRPILATKSVLITAVVLFMIQRD